MWFISELTDAMHFRMTFQNITSNYKWIKMTTCRIKPNGPLGNSYFSVCWGKQVESCFLVFPLPLTFLLKCFVLIKQIRSVSGALGMRTEYALGDTPVRLGKQSGRWLCTRNSMNNGVTFENLKSKMGKRLLESTRSIRWRNWNNINCLFVCVWFFILSTGTQLNLLTHYLRTVGTLGGAHDVMKLLFINSCNAEIPLNHCDSCIMEEFEKKNVQLERMQMKPPFSFKSDGGKKNKKPPTHIENTASSPIVRLHKLGKCPDNGFFSFSELSAPLRGQEAQSQTVLMNFPLCVARS